MPTNHSFRQRCGIDTVPGVDEERRFLVFNKAIPASSTALTPPKGVPDPSPASPMPPTLPEATGDVPVNRAVSNSAHYRLCDNPRIVILPKIHCRLENANVDVVKYEEYEVQVRVCLQEQDIWSHPDLYFGKGDGAEVHKRVAQTTRPDDEQRREAICKSGIELLADMWDPVSNPAHFSHNNTYKACSTAD